MRGVDVKLVLPERVEPRGDVPRGPELLRPLLEAGVEICEYLPGIVHAKTMVVDGAGRARRQREHGSAELPAQLRGARHGARREHRGGAARRVQRDAARSRVVESAAWSARGWGPRVKEGASRLVSPLL